MKLRMLCILSVLCATGTAAADTHVTFAKHVDGWYSGGVNHPEQESTYHFWIGAKKLAFVTDRSTVVIDPDKKNLTVSFHDTRTYAQTALPLKWSALVSGGLLQFLENYPLTGTVARSKERRKVGKWPCSGYSANSWLEYQGERVYETEATMWVTKAVPFNWRRVTRLMSHLRKWGNLADALIAQYEKIKGFPVRTEITHFEHGFTYAEVHEVTSIANEKPPEGTYSVPEGYTKKDQLTIQDLQDE